MYCFLYLCIQSTIECEQYNCYTCPTGSECFVGWWNYSFNIKYNGSIANAQIARDQIAKFTNGASTNIGFDEGILLTTGKSQVAVGPNNSSSLSNASATAITNDPDLFC